MITTTTLIGLGAALCTTFSFVPQALKVIKTKNTKDLSLGMYVVFVVGVSLWLAYGLLLEDLPMILANVVTLVLSLTILGYKIRYK
jgi:MtN3 and saliva related transmembrane protein